jgi:hypothetical protein
VGEGLAWDKKGGGGGFGAGIGACGTQGVVVGSTFRDGLFFCGAVKPEATCAAWVWGAFAYGGPASVRWLAWVLTSDLL